LSAKKARNVDHVDASRYEKAKRQARHLGYFRLPPGMGIGSIW